MAMFLQLLEDQLAGSQNVLQPSPYPPTKLNTMLSQKQFGRFSGCMACTKNFNAPYKDQSRCTRTIKALSAQPRTPSTTTAPSTPWCDFSMYGKKSKMPPLPSSTWKPP